jgi:hypothetical protein
MRYTRARVSKSLFPRLGAEVAGVGSYIGYRLQIDLWQAVPDPGLQRARRRM